MQTDPIIKITNEKKDKALFLNAHFLIPIEFWFCGASIFDKKGTIFIIRKDIVVGCVWGGGGGGPKNGPTTCNENVLT